MLFSGRATVRVRIRFNVWLVTGYARVFVLLSVVIVLYPDDEDDDEDAVVGRRGAMFQRFISGAACQRVAR